MISRAGTSTRALAIALLATSLLAVPARAATVAQPPPAGARLLTCRRSPLLAARVAVVSAWMRPLPNGRRLQLRIDLYQRTPGARWTLRSDVPGLGVWIAPSDPLLGTRPDDVFKYRQSVGRLVVPASYRFRVGFRWLDGGGAVVRTTSVTTAACQQPDLRPDLTLDAVQVTPSPRGGLVRYAVTVRNIGRSPAPRSVVAATLPGDATPNARQHAVPRLAPGASVVVAFTGPGCPAGAQPASFVVDPANVLEEANESNNELAAICPAP